MLHEPTHERVYHGQETEKTTEEKKGENSLVKGRGGARQDMSSARRSQL